MMDFIRKRLEAWRRSWAGSALEEQQQQLVQLYWNRAELKKELTKSHDDAKLLRQQLRQQEDLRQGVEERLLRLEHCLGDPINSHHASTYFQLRLLWRTAKDLLALFSRELHRLQDEQERRQHELDSQSTRTKILNDIQQRIAIEQQQFDQLSLQLAAKIELRNRLRWVWNIYRRRLLTQSIAHIEVQIQESSELLLKLNEDFATVTSEPLPPFVGMSLSGSRMVNTAVLAFGEWTVMNLPRLELALFARDAMHKAVEDARYGSKEECLAINALVMDALAKLAQLNPASAEFGERAKALRARVVYNNAIDTVPTETSLGYLQSQSAASGSTLRVSVLADDYWEVSQFLLR